MMGRFTAALSSRYVVEREIGHGGMATVYLARDLRHDSTVALKVLHPDLAPHLASERFAREIRITAGLQHPNILPILDSGEAAGIPYYAMPYVEGHSLATRLERETQLPIIDALEIARQIARALAYAHERGYVHRDIKPANILLSHGQVIVADFGIARAIDASSGERITESGLVVGTPPYMSPEQSAGSGVVDGRSDIYSVACLLFEMLVGAPPFVGPTPQSVMARHAVDPPPSIRTVRSTVSPAIEAVITKALAKVPADRYANAAEFAKALDAAERAQTAENERLSSAATSAPAISKRSRMTIALGGALVVAALGFSAWRLLTPHDQLDRNRITVFPLTVSASFNGPPAIGEDIATVAGHMLDGAGAFRWIDGWRLLPASLGIRSSRDALDPALTRRLARSQRSAFYLSGSVVSLGDSVAVDVFLYDVAGDSVVKHARATGPTAEVWRAGLRSVNGILPALVPDATARDLVSEWADRSPDAVAHFLLGESSFRRARAAEALTHYREAVRLDSTFALAAVRGAQAATWDHRAGEAESLIRRALGLKMSPRFTHFALGYAAYLDGRPDSAIAELRRSLALDPELAAAWMQLGETYTHLLPIGGRVDALADTAFQEAIRLDSSAAHILFHPIESRLRRGLAHEASPLLQKFLAAKPDTMLGAQVRVMYTCVSTGAARVSWKNEVSAHPLAVLAAGQSLAASGQQLPCAESAYRAIRTYETPEMAAASPSVDARRWTALVGLTGILIAEGRAAEAIVHVDSAIARKEGGASLYLVGSAVAPELATRANESAHTVRQVDSTCVRCTVDRLWQLTVWAATTRDTSALQGFRVNLAGRSETTASLAPMLARAADAKLALLRRDTTAALAALRGVLASPASNATGELLWKESSARGPERLAYARLLLARREFQGALDAASLFDSPASQSFTTYLAPSLEVRIAAADSLNYRSVADGYRDRLQRLKASSPHL